MFYVGLDIHDKRIAICVLSEAGQVAGRPPEGTPGLLSRLAWGLTWLEASRWSRVESEAPSGPNQGSDGRFRLTWVEGKAQEPKVGIG